MRPLPAALAGLAIGAAATGFAWAQTPQPAAADAPWPQASIEIFKLAPGKQEAFIRRIARSDEVRKAGGLPPTEIFLHEDGSDWDVIVYKPHRAEKPTPAQEAAMAAKRKELGIESGPAYFVAVRELIASHSDSTAIGPISAGQWLAKLDAWRAEHPPQPGHNGERPGAWPP